MNISLPAKRGSRVRLAICCRTALPGPSCGCALPAKIDLHRHLRVIDQRGNDFQVAHQQIRALVGREPAGKADRQRVGAEGPRNCASTEEARPAAPPGRTARRRVKSISRAFSVWCASHSSHRPRPRSRPRSRASAARRPVGAEMPLVHLAHLRREPGLHVDAVGDVADRHVILAQAGIERHPHRARYVSVQRGHGVGPPARLQRQHRHAELLALIVRVDAAEAGSPS